LAASTKELLARFRADDWADPGDMEMFIVEAAGAPGLAHKALEVLNARPTGRELERHRARCTLFERLVRKAPEPSLFGPFIEALKGAEVYLRGTLLTLIPLVNDPSEHKALCALLRSNEPQVRRAGAQLISEVGGRVAVQLLTEWVKESSFPGRREAMDALGACAGHYAIPALRSVVQVGDSAEKAQALKMLGEPKIVGRAAHQALEAIAEALDQKPTLRPAAIAAFCRICREDDYFLAIAPYLDAPEVDVVRAAITGMQRFRSPRVFAALERKLRAGPNALRLAVIETLEVVGSDEILPVLVEAVGHKQQLIRNRAAEALQHLGRTGKIDLARTVIWLMNSRDVNVRRMAAELAASSPDHGDQLWPKLLKLLRDSDWWVRERVADALVDLAKKKLTPHLLPYLADPSEVVRRFTVDLVARLEDPQSIGALLKVAANDSDWWARERAVEALARLKDQRVVPHLIKLLQDNDLRLACIDALSRLGAREAAPDIARIATADDPDARLIAVRCLASFGEGRLTLEAALDDEDARVRTAAREGLARLRSVPSDGPSHGPIIDGWLSHIARNDGDDLLVSAGHAPTMKKLGRTTPIRPEPVRPDDVEQLLKPVLRPEHWAELERRGDADLSYESAEGLRFRVNAYRTEAGLAAAFRIIRGRKLDFEALGLPEVIRRFADLKNGLVIIGGPTGSGKSTTLSAIIDHILRTRCQHLIMLEDPIETVHRSGKCLVNQREIGSHAPSFSSALRASLREDPDVILVGEMRDLPTITAAVSAAETGHLVLATLHAVSADASIDRLIDAFPAAQQEQVRSMLAESLRAVVCQHLFVRRDTPGRALAVEVMINSDAVSNLIRKGKTFQIPSIIAAAAESGMRTMDSDLMRLVKAGRIFAEDAYAKARSTKEFEELLSTERQSAQLQLPSLSSLFAAAAAEDAGADPALQPPGAESWPPRGSMRGSNAAVPSMPREPAPPASAPPPRSSNPGLPSPGPAPQRASNPAAPIITAREPAPVPSAPPPRGSNPAVPSVAQRAPAVAVAAPAANLPKIRRTRRGNTGAQKAFKPSSARAAPVLGGSPIDDPPTGSDLPVIDASVSKTGLEPAFRPGAAPKDDDAAPAAAPGEGENQARAAWAQFATADDRFARAADTLMTLAQVIAKEPTCAVAHYFCARVYLSIGDARNARRWFERTLAVDPRHGDARQRLDALRS
jgi:twitching motility protein PilT